MDNITEEMNVVYKDMKNLPEDHKKVGDITIICLYMIFLVDNYFIRQKFLYDEEISKFLRKKFRFWIAELNEANPEEKVKYLEE